VADTVGRAMVDYRSIRVSPTYRRLRPADTVGWHLRSVRWLRDTLPQETNPTVVVTHHAPSALSLAPHLADDPVSAAYASHLDELGATPGLALWVHGHTHRSVDYQMGTVRVLSNQRGYEDEPATGFDPGLVVEVP
jgi:calcineurin-like phosphoesterase family protein